MVVVGIRSMPLKFIGKEVYLRARDPFRLSKDPRFKICPNT
jgi:hypothetical protein